MNKFFLFCITFWACAAMAQTVYKNNDIHFDYIKDAFIDAQGKPATGTVKSYFPNGKVQNEKEYKNGQQNGADVRYYDNGQIRARANFKNDKLDGKVEEYTADGRLLRTRFYKDGEVSEEAAYNVETQKQAISLGDDGSTVYYENGNPRYVHNKEGLKFYYRTGPIWMELAPDPNNPKKVTGFIYSLLGEKTALTEQQLESIQFALGFDILFNDTKLGLINYRERFRYE